MRRATRFLVVLLVGLAVMAVVAHATLTQTTHAWFERDLALRTQLAVLSARQSCALRKGLRSVPLRGHLRAQSARRSGEVARS